ncbi:ABC transporter substrate-binding protein [Cohnella abietis]|uniref:Sugar ABC transporter substrate-binding protein n=1 Tax=Cohnella abietis TaxID=2507935 RepID=A0A3T1D207_9BACL|nr:sugar ABC transporter substrate-binding protein [Cohnella abietis]BBI32147.1 sugar ABC transporter substrate-binding protein [Cohnella abietis]
MKKLNMFIALLIVISLVLAGCGDSNKTGSASGQPSEGQTDKPFAGEKINVLILKTPAWDALVSKTAEFEKATGMKVNFDSLPEKSFFQKLDVSLSARTGEYDVVWGNNKSLPSMISGDWIEPIDSYLNDASLTEASYEYSDFIPKLAKNLSMDGKIYGLPGNGEANILYYNKKMFEEAGLTAPPKNLTELKEYAKQLTKPEKKQSGIVVRATREGNANSFSWIMVWKMLGGNWLEQADAPYAVLDKQAAIDATNLWIELVNNYAPEGIHSYGFNESLLAFQQGKAAMMIDVNTFMPEVENPDKSTVAGNVGYSVLEGVGDEYTVGPTWGIFMPKDTNKKTAAWEFMKWATSKEVMQDMATKKQRSDATRTSVIDSEEFKNNFNAEWGEANKIALNHTDFGYTPLVPEGSEIREALSIAISKAATGQASVEKALKEANDRIKKIMGNK